MNQTRKETRANDKHQKQEGIAEKVIATSLLKNSNKASSKILFLLELDVPFTKNSAKKYK
jgi:hypothetical protein